jgi:hypothetical protein
LEVKKRNKKTKHSHPSKDIFLPLLKVIKTAHNETGYITLLITVEETCGGSFYLRFQLSGKNHKRHSKEEFFGLVKSMADDLSIEFGSWV